MNFTTPQALLKGEFPFIFPYKLEISSHQIIHRGKKSRYLQKIQTPGGGGGGRRQADHEEADNEQAYLHSTMENTHANKTQHKNTTKPRP